MIDTRGIIKKLEGDVDGFNIRQLREKEVREFIRGKGLKYKRKENLSGKFRGLTFTKFRKFKAEPNPKLSFNLPVGPSEIHIDKNLNEPMRVYAAMHELCHALYHRNELEPDGTTTAQCEFQANVVGVLAVIPTREIILLSNQNNLIDIPFLVKRYKVDEDVAKFRLTDIVLAISHEKFAELLGIPLRSH